MPEDETLAAEPAAPIALPTDPVPPISYKPLGDRVVLRRLKETVERRGALLINKELQDMAQLCQIVAMPDTQPAGSVLREVRVGSIVGIAKHSGWNFVLDGDDFVVVKAEDLLLVSLSTARRR